jgi:Lrp/AsnC family leucine-responsive transcriptional regulator
MRDLDAIDRQLLVRLRANARESHARLGEVVRLSRTAVRQRIERLERDGWIRGYTIVERADESPASVSATLLVYRHDRVRGADVISALADISEVRQCDVVTGDFDLMVRVEAPNPERIRQVWQEVASLPGVRDITTAVTLSTVIAR